MRLRESSHFGAERNNRIVPGASVINPPASTLGSLNAILTGTSRSYRVGDFIGALSIKAVISGRANWHVGSRTFAVGENCYLVLNDRQRYALTIDSPEETTTFCLFFQRGFVEDIWRASLSSSSRLLDAPESGENDPSPGFFERLEPWSDSLRTTVRHVYRLVRSHEIESGVWEESFVSVGEALVRHEACVLQKAAALPVIRASTRMELCKRANRARDLLLSSWNRSVSLREVAREACLSPYHLHRLLPTFLWAKRLINW
jgi:hypothetical protein